MHLSCDHCITILCLVFGANRRRAFYFSRGSMTYEQYISSQLWKDKREERLKLDGYRCRLCDHDGSLHRLEVHHRPSSYAKIPNESVADDLIILCRLCHDNATNVIRDRRYGSKTITIDVVAETKVERNTGYVGKRTVSVDIILPDDYSQRANSVTVKQVLTLAETDYVKEEKSRR